MEVTYCHIFTGIIPFSGLGIFPADLVAARFTKSFCAAMQIRICITIEAVFVVLVGTIRKIVPLYARF